MPSPIYLYTKHDLIKKKTFRNLFLMQPLVFRERKKENKWNLRVIRFTPKLLVSIAIVTLLRLTVLPLLTSRTPPDVIVMDLSSCHAFNYEKNNLNLLLQYLFTLC